MANRLELGPGQMEDGFMAFFIENGSAAPLFRVVKVISNRTKSDRKNFFSRTDLK
jgi:hypothetical protein